MSTAKSTQRRCGWCATTLTWKTRDDALYCTPACRVKAHRSKKRQSEAPEAAVQTYVELSPRGTAGLEWLDAHVDSNDDVLHIEWTGRVTCVGCGRGADQTFSVRDSLLKNPTRHYCPNCVTPVAWAYTRRKLRREQWDIRRAW